MTRRQIRAGYALFAVMTLVSFGGPFLINSVLNGGESKGWPPDRPIEWVVIVGLTAVVVGILAGLGVLYVANLKHMRVVRERLQAEREANIRAAAEADRGAL